MADAGADASAARPGETAQAFLRRVTRPWHDAVEATFAPFDLATAAGLGGFLLRQAVAVLPLERALDAAGIGARVPDWTARRRSEALLADLRSLGLSCPGGAPPVGVPSHAYALGLLYVLEGSKLGGRVLLRRVLASPDPRVRSASGFLGQHTPGEWPRFTALLDASATETRADLRAGAEAAFALFRAAAAGEEATISNAAALVQFSHA